MSNVPFFSARLLVAGAFVSIALSGCGESSVLPVDADKGTEPTLPQPRKTLIPTVNIAPATGWADGSVPDSSTRTCGHRAGHRTQAPALGACAAQWGRAGGRKQTLRPSRKMARGIKGWVMGLVMKRAGAGVPSADRITLLRDADGDGQAEVQKVFLQGLRSPFGMALVGSNLYVANTDAVLRFPYTPGQTQIDAPGEQLLALPAGPINHHWTKNLIASPDGRRSTSQSAPTATWARTAWWRKKLGPRSGK